MGHTMSIHSRNDDIILQFGLKKPAFRIVVNTPTTLGSIGMTTGLDPAMTLGCGGYGGNITSDNISPRHLLNIKRLAYETSPAPVRREALPDPAAMRLPKAPAPPRVPGGIPAEPLARRIDQFLASRGYTPPVTSSGSPAAPSEIAGRTAPAAAPSPSTFPSPVAVPEPVKTPAADKPAEFVCEDDVRQAVRQGRTIVLGERTIVTPSARDLGEQHRIFIQARWPR
jgi:acetaldehyde dehydrogenase (acetylating)